MTKRERPGKRRRVLFAGGAAAGSLLIAGLAAEVLLRFFYPQEYMSPRWRYSPEYGSVLDENVTMVQARPGRWKYTYWINQYGYRGPAVPVSDHYDRPNIVALGDSYTFGHGVADGEEYPAVIKKELEGRYNVINLGVGGWGLTQEIRRYYDFGARYRPRVAILQFSANDPTDDLVNDVTRREGDRLVFADKSREINVAKKYLSRSLVQRSQVYNLIRNRLYPFLEQAMISRGQRSLSAATAGEGENPPRGIPAAANPTRPDQGGTLVPPLPEKYYNDLLELFARDLSRQGIKLIMIAVNNQLDQFPFIKAKVMELNAEGALDYVEVAPWFAGVKDFGSPEGHFWGAKAHAIIGRGLAQHINQLDHRDAKAPGASSATP